MAPPPGSREDSALHDVEVKLRTARYAYEQILPVFTVLDRKKQGLELEIKLLEDQKLKLSQGQLVFEDHGL